MAATALAMAGVWVAGGLVLSDQALAAVLAAVEASTAVHTNAAYSSGFRRFTVWCGVGGFPAPPARPMVVAHYVTAAAVTGASAVRPVDVDPFGVHHQPGAHAPSGSSRNNSAATVDGARVARPVPTSSHPSTSRSNRPGTSASHCPTRRTSARGAARPARRGTRPTHCWLAYPVRGGVQRGPASDVECG